VRVSDFSADAEICRYIDAGAQYVICPMVNSKAACERFVANCYYPPLGGRSFGPYRHMLGSAGFTTTKANAQLSTLAMIETKQAVDAVDDILSVPNLSGLFIGPNDLGLSLGFPPSSAPTGKVLEVILYILSRAKAKGKYCGIFCTSVETARQMSAAGFTFVVFGSDLGLAVGAAETQLDTCRM
jgi:4-hydroxy-2-oxoheptanedioate aldolase